jgi:hypothetical protein
MALVSLGQFDATSWRLAVRKPPPVLFRIRLSPFSRPVFSDIDWEFPGYGPNGGTPADRENFVLLLRDVRSALDAYANATYPDGERTFGLTATLPCLPALIDHQDVLGLTEVLTELSLMTFDFHGIWSEVVGVNSPLYDQPADSSDSQAGRSVDGCVERWLHEGADKSKINIGLPFYGRSYGGATDLYASFDGPDALNFWADGGEPQYYSILEKMPNMTALRDDVTKTQYAFFEAGGIVSFDDNEAICDKVEYAREQELHGLLIWELSGDLTEDLKTPLLDAVNYKLEQGDLLDCDIFRLETMDEDGQVAVADGGEADPWYGEFQKKRSRCGFLIQAPVEYVVTFRFLTCRLLVQLTGRLAYALMTANNPNGKKKKIYSGSKKNAALINLSTSSMTVWGHRHTSQRRSQHWNRKSCSLSDFCFSDSLAHVLIRLLICDLMTPTVLRPQSARKHQRIVRVPILVQRWLLTRPRLSNEKPPS